MMLVPNLSASDHMDKPISVGDLVWVVMPKPCGCGRLGAIFTVRKVRPSVEAGWYCLQCKKEYPPEMGVEDELGDFISIWRVKRIPPMEELEGERSQEDMPVKTASPE